MEKHDPGGARGDNGTDTEDDATDQNCDGEHKAINMIYADSSDNAMGL